MDHKLGNKLFGKISFFLVIMSIFLFVLGVAFLLAENKTEMEFTLAVLFLSSGALMLYGGIKQVNASKVKAIEIKLYEEKIMEQLKNYDNKKPGETGINKSANDSATVAEDIHSPDIIAKWEYTKEEWELMKREERNRRLKEGIWVSLLVALFGGFILYKYKQQPLGISFLFAIVFGILFSLLKVLVNNSLFGNPLLKTLIISTNALLINGKFKTLNDSLIKLQYLKPIKKDANKFIEFSMEWMTRRGPTNDQFRIYVPKRFEIEMDKVFDYYRSLGVKIET